MKSKIVLFLMSACCYQLAVGSQPSQLNVKSELENRDDQEAKTDEEQSEYQWRHSQRYEVLQAFEKSATKSEKETQIGLAIFDNTYKEMEFWLEHGFDPDLIFDRAFVFQKPLLMKLAIKFGADPSKIARGPSWYTAVVSNNDAVFDVFLSDYRIDLGNDNRSFGMSLLQSAVLWKKTDHIKRLLFLGVQPNLKEQGENELCQIAYERAYDNQEIQDMLKKAAKGDFSFITHEERERFRSIAMSRMNLNPKSKMNIFTQLMNRQAGIKKRPLSKADVLRIACSPPMDDAHAKAREDAKNLKDGKDAAVKLDHWPKKK